MLQGYEQFLSFLPFTSFHLQVHALKKAAWLMKVQVGRKQVLREDRNPLDVNLAVNVTLFRAFLNLEMHIFSVLHRFSAVECQEIFEYNELGEWK